MIRADTRVRLGKADLDLVLLLLSRGSELARRQWERRLAQEGVDALLDAPELPERLLAVRTLLLPSEALLLYVLMRHTLLRAAIHDRELADYLAAMVLDFGRRDRAWRVDWNDDARHHYVVDILADLEQTNEPRRYKVAVHLGNYTLWLAGIFPHYIAARRVRRGGPGLEYYEGMGRRGFGMASDHAWSDELGLSGVFRLAAERFGEVRIALNQLSNTVFFPSIGAA